MPDTSGNLPLHSAGQPILTAGGALLVIAALYFGQDFFIPFTLAVLLAFALSPIVSGLRRWRVPRVAAVVLAVTLAFITIASISYIVGNQLVRLAEDMPTFRVTMVEKVKTLRGSEALGGGLLKRVIDTFEGVEQELAGPTNENPEVRGGDSSAVPIKPLPVTIEPSQRPLAVLGTVLGPIIEALATVGIVIVFLVFVLLEKAELRDRFIKLLGAGDLQTSTAALSEAGRRVSRYLLMQLVVNITYGLPIGIGLYLIGVPNAVLWGLLAAVLRFIPFLGPFLAALFPLTLAFAVDPGWTMLLWVVGLFVVIELISNNVVEPWLYGSSTGLSSLAIISAAIFWTSLWGPIGLVLSTPLTVCLIVIGRYVPQMRFLGVLLGSDPVLTPEEQIYQRLLANNVEAAVEIAESYTDANSARAFYDQVALPVLRLAENDRQRNTGDMAYKQNVAEGMTAVIREVAGHIREAEDMTTPRQGRPIRALGVPDLCIAGRTGLDAAAAEMVSQGVGARGIGTRVLPPVSISQQGIGQLDLAGIEVVCLSYLAPDPRAFARFVCRRLKRRSPDLKIVVCLWNPSPALQAATDLKDRLAADAVVFSVEAAVAQVDAFVTPHLSDPMQAPSTPENEKERLATLHRLGFPKGRGRYFDEVAARLTAAFDTPIALVTVIDEHHQRWPGAAGLTPSLDACRKSERETSVCGHVVAQNDVLVVEDVGKDSRFANNPFLLENGIRFYAGAPLRTSGGFAIGSLCVIDTKPRKFGDRERKVLRTIADDVMATVEAASQNALPASPANIALGHL